jgi:hypothetical protein
MRIRRGVLGLNPRQVDSELATERAAHAALLEGARRQLSGLAAEELSLTDRLARLRARLAHLQSAVTSMALTEARDQRIAIRAEERFQQEVAALEASHRLHSAELRREEASLRALLLRDEESFRGLAARLRAAIFVDRSGAPPGRTTTPQQTPAADLPTPDQTPVVAAAISLDPDLDPEGPERS